MRALWLCTIHLFRRFDYCFIALREHSFRVKDLRRLNYDQSVPIKVTLSCIFFFIESPIRSVDSHASSFYSWSADSGHGMGRWTGVQLSSCRCTFSPSSWQKRSAIFYCLVYFISHIRADHVMVEAIRAWSFNYCALNAKFESAYNCAIWRLVKFLTIYPIVMTDLTEYICVTPRRIPSTRGRLLWPMWSPDRD